MIGLELKTYTPKAAGVGRYSIQLVNHLLKRKNYAYFGYTAPQTASLHVPLGAQQRYVNAQSTVLRSITIPQFHWHKKIELMHVLDGSNYYGLALKGIKRVTTIHDLIALKFPQYFTRKMRIVLKSRFKHAVKKSDHLIADSQATKEDLLCYFPAINESKITVIPLASSISKNGCSDSIISSLLQKLITKENPFFLSVATQEPRKNLKLTIEAFQYLRNKIDPNLHLVLAGQKGWLQSAAFHESESMLQNVIVTGQVSDQELKGWYKAAMGLIYPSFYEGFGLPVLEAMAMGCPVITSNCSSLPEVAGEAALLVDPYSLADLTHAMQQVLDSSSLRASLTEKGLKQSAQFSWEKTAAETEQVYAQLLS